MNTIIFKSQNKDVILFTDSINQINLISYKENNEIEIFHKDGLKKSFIVSLDEIETILNQIKK